MHDNYINKYHRPIIHVLIDQNNLQNVPRMHGTEIDGPQPMAIRRHANIVTIDTYVRCQCTRIYTYLGELGRLLQGPATQNVRCKDQQL
jgi:hypothetical protein